MTTIAPPRILLTLAGHSPAIITEVLYALTQTREISWLPDEIHVITTQSGKQKLLDGLLGEQGALQALCHDYGLPAYPPETVQVHVINHDGQWLDDIQTDADNTVAADFITAKVRELTANPDTSLHVSIAGGRKTMSYYLGYAMSLFGRMQDSLSHVLVDESRISRDFYYPPPGSDITVMLADIPFVRLREGLSFAKALSEGRHTFNEVVGLVQQQFAGVHVALEGAQLYASGIPVEHVKFKETALAVYVWLLLRHQAGREPVCYRSKDDSGNLGYSHELLAVYRQLHGEKGINKMETAIEASGLTLGYLGPYITHCNKALEYSLNKAAVHYKIIRHEDGRHLAYVLSKELAAASIQMPNLHLPASKQ